MRNEMCRKEESMKHASKAFAFLLSLVLCLGLLPGAARAEGERYDDVPRSHWAYDSIEKASLAGLMKGYGNRKFGPNDTLTIAQVAQMICNAHGDQTAAANGYWAYGAVEHCRYTLQCLPDFGAITAANYDVPASRELAVYMIVHGLELGKSTTVREITLADLPDGNEISAEYRDAVVTAYRKGVVTGSDAAGTFHPKSALTRAEGAALFTRAVDAAPDPGPYLTFGSDDYFQILTDNRSKNWDGILEYSTDTRTWAVWDGKTGIPCGADYKLYLRGTNNTVISGLSSLEEPLSWQFWSYSYVTCSGNIENLLDYRTVAAGRHPAMGEGCFYGLFAYCSELTTAPKLPATELAPSCYGSMFEFCTSLTAAPALPATTLADYCYQSMFWGCESLTAAPVLPATTLAEGCYNCMLYGCTSLTKAPALPATTLADWCYAGMFGDCTSLTAAPALPATMMMWCCYYEMFYGCTSLTTAPALPATTLDGYCYSEMFYDCTSLTAVPALPATTLAYGCYWDMFNGCTGIKLSKTRTGSYTTPYRIPASGSGTADDLALEDMFAGTGGMFTGTPDVDTTYYLHNSNSIVG